MAKKTMKTLKGLKGSKNNMTKSDLVDIVANDTKMTKVDVKTVIDSVFKSIPELTKSGGYITISGFGTFKETKTKPRTINYSAKQRKAFGTDAKTVRVPAHKKLSFSSSKNY